MLAFQTVESVVFCRPSLLQLSLYRHLLTSRAVRSCLTSYSFGGSRHLVCIGALKKLCNDPSLIYSQCQEAKEMADTLDMDEVSCVCHKNKLGSWAVIRSVDCFLLKLKVVYCWCSSTSISSFRLTGYSSFWVAP